MSFALVKALIVLVPTLMLLLGSILVHLSGRTIWSFFQVLGAVCFVLVVLVHLCEALNWFPSMRWGAEDSVGHYVDLWTAILGLSLFPIGYLFHTLTRPRS